MPTKVIFKIQETSTDEPYGPILFDSERDDMVDIFGVEQVRKLNVYIKDTVLIKGKVYKYVSESYGITLHDIRLTVSVRRVAHHIGT